MILILFKNFKMYAYVHIYKKKKKQVKTRSVIRRSRMIFYDFRIKLNVFTFA